MLYLGDGLLGIHTGQGGVKTIHWPRKAVFRDAVTGQVLRNPDRTPGNSHAAE